MDHATLGIPSEYEDVREYCERTSHADVWQRWDFYLALNLFRLAARALEEGARALDSRCRMAHRPAVRHGQVQCLAPKHPAMASLAKLDIGAAAGVKAPR